jgi:hypothetical protein
MDVCKARVSDEVASNRKVCPDVSDNVDELKGLTEKPGLVEPIATGRVLVRQEVHDFRPKLADAARNKIGVFFQFALVF